MWDLHDARKETSLWSDSSTWSCDSWLWTNENIKWYILFNVPNVEYEEWVKDIKTTFFAFSRIQKKGKATFFCHPLVVSSLNPYMAVRHFNVTRII